MLDKRDTGRVAVVGVLLALASLAAYLPALESEFTNYDDPSYVTENALVRGGLTWAGVAGAFTQHTGNWHPLTWLSHMLDCQLYGLHPAGHHLTNLLFHAANSVLLFLLLRCLTGTLWRSACVAALFALHPMHVESVAWVSERKDVLSGFFFLLTLWAYAQYAKEECRRKNVECRNEVPASANTQDATVTRLTLHAMRYYGLALLLFALGLMSKPMLVTVPFVLLLLDYWPLQRWGVAPDSLGPAVRAFGLSSVIRHPLLLEKLPFFALAGASCVVTILVQHAGGAVAPLEQIPPGLRLANVAVSYCRYIWKLIWPVDLAVIYPYVFHWAPGAVLAAVAVLGAVTVVTIWQRRQRPYLLTGWAWYLGTLVPVIGLVQVGNQSMADRYTYLPAIGLFLILAWGAAELANAWIRCRAGVAWGVTALLVVCAILTPRQVRHWRNTETLFRHALAVTTNNLIACNSLGFYYAEQQRLQDAASAFEAALAVNPESPHAWSGSARVLVEQKRYGEAIANCQRALQLNPRVAEAHSTLGVALMAVGRTNEAIVEYSEAIRLRPDYASAHYNLGNALARQGQYDQAQEHYRASLRSDGGSADAHNNLAYLLAREGKLDEAISQFRSALVLQPGLWQARYGLGNALAKQGQYEAAAGEYALVLKERPKQVSVYVQLGSIRSVQGRLDEAAQSFSEALRIQPDNAPAQQQLAAVLRRQGKTNDTSAPGLQ
jgi:protein O-mannosyl-transferase